MVSQKIINDIITKCGLQQKYNSFIRNSENYLVEDISLEPIEITPTLHITDTEEIMDIKGIIQDPKYKDIDGDPILYGASEMHQDKLQKGLIIRWKNLVQ